MKFQIIVAHVEPKEGEKSWDETYSYSSVKTQEAALDWAVSLVDKYNKTLSGNERARKLIDIVFPEHQDDDDDEDDDEDDDDHDDGYGKDDEDDYYDDDEDDYYE